MVMFVYLSIYKFIVKKIKKIPNPHVVEVLFCQYEPHISQDLLFSVSVLIFCLLFFSTVICNFRGSVTQGLALEVGETVQILEKFEGKPAIG